MSTQCRMAGLGHKHTPERHFHRLTLKATVWIWGKGWGVAGAAGTVGHQPCDFGEVSAPLFFPHLKVWTIVILYGCSGCKIL